LASLVSSIKHREGGIEGFMKRVRMAGFSSNLDQWLQGKGQTALSQSITAELLGAGYLDKLAERNGIGIEDATEAAGIALPGALARLAPMALDHVAITEESALNTTDKPNWIAGIVAALALMGTVYAAVSCGAQDPMRKSAVGAPANVLPLQGLKPNAEAGEALSEAAITLTRDGQGFQYSGLVASSMVVEMTETLQKVVGAEKVSGALIGGNTKPAEWTEKFTALLTLLADPSAQASMTAEGDSLTFRGTVLDPAAFEASVRALVSERVVLSFEQLKSPQVVNSKPK
jgi:hypothetical protein